MHAFILVLSLVPTFGSYAQQADEQLWLDLVLAKNVAEWTFSTDLGGRTMLSDDKPRWTSWRIAPLVVRSMTPHWDLSLGLPLIRTEQANGIMTFETRIQLGTRLFATPFKRVQTSLNIRFEERFQRTLEPTEATSRSTRTRVRAEVVVPLDTRNYHADSMWYALADCEVFITLDQDVDERFSDRLRSRVGFGRKFSYNWRAEFIYCFQQSRNSITDDDLSSDNIFRFRLKYYFHRADQHRERLHTGS